MSPPARPAITRVTLSNGYRAYQPRALLPPARQKRVRFVKGYVTVPATLREPPGAAPAPGTGAGDGARDSVPMSVSTQEDGALPQEEETGKPARAGRFVERGGFTVWWKAPRFRGSGAVPVMDDPLRDGEQLARSGVGLPSDRWREPVREPARVGVVGREQQLVERDSGRRRDAGASGELRYEEGEREEGFTLGEIVRDEAAFAVKVANPKRKEGKNEGEESVLHLEEEEALEGSGELMDAESSDECESLPDLCVEKSTDWVLVLVPEEDEGDDWVSLAGSWMPLVGAAEEKRVDSS